MKGHIMNMRAAGDVSIRLVIAIVVFAAGCISAALYADDRYAKTQDLKSFISQAKRDTKQAADLLRKQMLEDKKFEYDLMPDTQKSDIQRAMAQRNNTQLQEVVNRIAATEQER